MQASKNTSALQIGTKPLLAWAEFCQSAHLWFDGMAMPSLLHRSIFLPGPAGRLEALLWGVPQNERDAPPPLAAVVCHPHPLFGGTMHNKVVYQVAKTLHRFALPVLRFNFRGAGASEGRHDEGRGELADVKAALD